VNKAAKKLLAVVPALRAGTTKKQKQRLAVADGKPLF